MPLYSPNFLVEGAYFVMATCKSAQIFSEIWKWTCDEMFCGFCAGDAADATGKWPYGTAHVAPAATVPARFHFLGLSAKVPGEYAR